MPSQKPDQLLDEIIRFLKKERELYGDFAIKPSEDSKREPSENDAASSQGANGNFTSESSTNYTSTSSPPKKSKSQEHLFEENEKDEAFYKIEDCESLEELRALCKQADVLRTDLENTNLVFGVGNPNADLMLIGEAPGAEEDKQGEPFVGRAGQLLNDILTAINFSRDDVYIANILKHRPPNNRNPKPEERERSLPFLLRQIDLIEPKLILCLGKISAQTLLDNDSTLSSMRGKFHTFRGKYELMATYHPAALLRHAKWKRPTWEDVQLLRKRYDELDCNP